MDSTEGLKINSKLVELVSEKYNEDQVLIITSNRSLRSSIKRVLTHFKIPIDNIGIADSYTQAASIIETHKPRIIFTSYTIDHYIAKDVLSLHRNNFPDPSSSIFCVFSDLDLKYMRSYKFEHGYDELYKGLSSIQDYINGLQAVFIKKLQLSKNDSFINNVRAEIRNCEPQKAITLLSQSDIDLEDVENFSLLGDIYLAQGHDEKALESFTFVLDDDPINYFALKQSALLYNKLGLFSEALQSAKQFLEHYKCIPDCLCEYIDIFLNNRDYVGFLSLVNSYIDDPYINKETKEKIIRSYLIAGKNLKEKSPDIAKSCFTDAIRLSGGNSFETYHKAIEELSEVETLKPVAIELFNKYRTNFESEDKIELTEFKVLFHTLDVAEVYARGLKLLRNNIKEVYLYQQVISSSINLGRKKESIEDLIFDACKNFPDHEDLFKGLLIKDS